MTKRILLLLIISLMGVSPLFPADSDDASLSEGLQTTAAGAAETAEALAEVAKQAAEEAKDAAARAAKTTGRAAAAAAREAKEKSAIATEKAAAAGKKAAIVGSRAAIVAAREAKELAEEAAEKAAAVGSKLAAAGEKVWDVTKKGAAVTGRGIKKGAVITAGAAILGAKATGIGIKKAAIKTKELAGKAKRKFGRGLLKFGSWLAGKEEKPETPEKVVETADVAEVEVPVKPEAPVRPPVIETPNFGPLAVRPFSFRPVIALGTDDKAYELNWAHKGGVPVKDIAIGVDDAAWGIGTDTYAYRFTGRQWRRSGTQQIQKIDVGSAVQVWAVGVDGSVYQWNDGWQAKPLPAGTALDLAVGIDGDVWCIERTSGSAYHLEGGTWRKKSTDAMKAIFVAHRNLVWALDKKGVAKQWSSRKNKFVTSPGSTRLTYLALGGSTNNIWGVASNGKTVVRLENGAWKAQGLDVDYTTNLVVSGRQHVWAISSDHTIVKWTGSGWQPFGRGATRIYAPKARFRKRPTITPTKPVAQVPVEKRKVLREGLHYRR